MGEWTISRSDGRVSRTSSIVLLAACAAVIALLAGLAAHSLVRVDAVAPAPPAPVRAPAKIAPAPHPESLRPARVPTLRNAG
jgi:hypothetical protein